MAGTAVFLGFTSTMVTLIGLVVLDIGRLSIERPILSTVCACGMIGSSFTRSFGPFNKELNLAKDSAGMGNLHIKDRFYKKTNEKLALHWGISWIQYVLALAAIVNTIHNAYEIGLRSVICFSCRGSSFLPLVWYWLTPVTQILILLLARIGFWQRQCEHFDVAVEEHNRNSSVLRSLRAWVRSEALLCSARNPISHETSAINPGEWREALGLIVPWVINAFLVVQFALSTIVMGSILFVRTQDATVIVIRFLLSVLLVRCIVAFEVEGMRYVCHQWRNSPLISVSPDEPTDLCLRDATAQDALSSAPIESFSTSTPEQSERWTQTEDV